MAYQEIYESLQKGDCALAKKLSKFYLHHSLINLEQAQSHTRIEMGSYVIAIDNQTSKILDQQISQSLTLLDLAQPSQ